MASKNATGRTRENAEKFLALVRTLGVTPVPVTVPRFSYYTAALGVEKAVFHDRLFRTDRARQIGPARSCHGLPFTACGQCRRLPRFPARATMLMMQLAEATSERMDVWLSIGTHSKGGAIAEDETPTQRAA